MIFFCFPRESVFGFWVLFFFFLFCQAWQKTAPWLGPDLDTWTFQVPVPLLSAGIPQTGAKLFFKIVIAGVVEIA